MSVLGNVSASTFTRIGAAVLVVALGAAAVAFAAAEGLRALPTSLGCTDTDGDGVCEDVDNCLKVPNSPVPVKLNARLAAGSDVLSATISPDGSTVVYRAAQDTPGVEELYSTPIGGGTPIKLNPTFTDGGVSSFKISPDGSTVVYIAFLSNSTQVLELYSVPIGGGAVTKLNPDLPPGADVFGDFIISRDSRSVVYKANTILASERLFHVPIDGGAAIQLTGGRVRNFTLTRDGSTIVYRATEQGFFDRLFSVPIEGGTPTMLNAPLPAGGNVSEDFALSADDSTVLYRADQELNNIVELYSVPIGGGIPEMLSPGPGIVRGFVVTRDGSRVVYEAVERLWSAPTLGGPSVPLTAALDNDATIESFLVTFDGKTVVYVAEVGGTRRLYSASIDGGGSNLLASSPDLGDDVLVTPNNLTVVYGTEDLFAVPILGGRSVRLNEPLPEGGSIAKYELIQRGRMILLRGQLRVAGQTEVAVVSVGGGPPAYVNGSLQPDGDVVGPSVGPGGRDLIYRADQEQDGVVELYSVPIGAFDLDGDGLGGACDCDDTAPGCKSACIDRDGDGVYACAGDCDDWNPACTSDCTDADADGLCVTVDCDDSTSACTTVCGDLDGDGLQVCEGDCDDTNALCMLDCTDADSDGVCVPTDCDDSRATCSFDCADPDADSLCNDEDLCDHNSEPAPDSYKLNGQLVEAGDVWAFAFSPDSQTLVYRAEQDANGTEDIYSVPSSGGTPIKLSGPLAPGVDVSIFEVTPNGAAVVYAAQQDTPGEEELYVVPLGGGTAIKLNEDLPAGGDVQQFAVSPDSTQVVYLADDASGGEGLFSVSIAGGTVTRLDGTPGADIVSFGITPDGANVIYIADSDESDIFELYRAPTPGGVATKLSAPLNFGQDVAEFQVTPDSDAVVYRVTNFNTSPLFSVPVEGGEAILLNALRNDRFVVTPDSTRVIHVTAFGDLFSVPVDGGPMVELRDNGVLDFVVSPDATRVVYRVNSSTDDLYSIDVAGGAPVNLSLSVHDQAPLHITPDSRRVVFQTNALELQSVPIEGGTPVQLDDLGFPNADLFFTPDSAVVTYRAQEQPDVREFYAVLVAGGAPVRLNGELPGGGSVDLTGLSPDGTVAAYRANEAHPGVQELFGRALRGLDLDGDGLGGACDCDDTASTCMTDCTDLDGDSWCADFDCDDGNPDCTGDCTDGDGDGYCDDVDCDADDPFCNESCADLDEDGLATCAGDCDDLNPTCVADCTDLDGDGWCADFDCDDENPNCLGSCTDNDLDGWCAGIDCDDSTPLCRGDCTDADFDGWCAGVDCNDWNKLCSSDCSDPDGDGVCGDFDCDDTNPECSFDCTDADGDGYCITDDCDDSNPNCRSVCADFDEDGFCVDFDCDDGAPECAVDCTDC